MASALLNFYRGTGEDGAGRTIEQVWAFDRLELESRHDFIQWLFPLRERSNFNPDAPTLSDEDVAAFRADLELQERLTRSLDLMLSFYGLKREGDAIEAGSEAQSGRAHWLSPNDHNHLRLSRIVQSLHALGLESEARALKRCLIDLAERLGHRHVTPQTLRYWKALPG